MVQAISINPDDSVPGGFLDDVDVTVKTSDIVIYDYQGKAPRRVCIHWELTGDALEQPAHQYWSIGDPKHFKPSKNGKEIHPVDPKNVKSLNDSSNGMLLLKELINVGFPANKVTTDVSIFTGMKFRAVQKAQARSGGLAQGKTILLPSKILKFPKGVEGEVEESAGAEGAAVDGIQAKAQSAIVNILADQKEISTGDLTTELFKAMANDESLKDVVALAIQEDFLKAGPWNYNSDEKKLTLPG